MKDRHREMTRKMREGATRPAVSEPQECRGLHTPAHRAHPPPLWPQALPRGSPTPATGDTPQPPMQIELASDPHPASETAQSRTLTPRMVQSHLEAPSAQRDHSRCGPALTSAL